MTASQGMGQVHLLGRQAAKLLVQSEDFKLFVKQELVPTLRGDAHGALEVVRLIYIGSLAGGTYTGGEIPIAAALSAMIRNITSAITLTDFLPTGSLAYEGLEGVLPRKCCADRPYRVCYCPRSRPARHPHEACLIEIPLCYEDDVLEDCLSRANRTSSPLRVSQARRAA